MSKECAFCNLETSNFSYFERYGKEKLDQAVLFESDNIYVKPELLPTSPYFHGLVVPRVHNYSFARNENIEDETGHLLWQIEQKIKTPIAWFEHGGVKDGAKTQSVYHNHAHVIGHEGQNIITYMKNRLTAEGVHFEEVGGLEYSPAFNVKKLGLSEVGYIYIQDGSHGLVAIDENDEFPSQIAQRNMSNLLSGRVLDWKKATKNEELAKLSVQRIADIIEICQR